MTLTLVLTDRRQIQGARAPQLDQSNGRGSECEFELLARLWDVLDKQVRPMDATRVTDMT